MPTLISLETSADTPIVLSESDLRHLRVLRSNNDHGRAYHYAAVLLKQTTVAEQLARINSQHEHRGYLTLELEGQRRRAYEQMLAAAKQLLSATDYKKLYGCF